MLQPSLKPWLLCAMRDARGGVIKEWRSPVVQLCLFRSLLSFSKRVHDALESWVCRFRSTESLPDCFWLCVPFILRHTLPSHRGGFLSLVIPAMELYLSSPPPAASTAPSAPSATTPPDSIDSAMKGSPPNNNHNPLSHFSGVMMEFEVNNSGFSELAPWKHSSTGKV